MGLNYRFRRSGADSLPLRWGALQLFERALWTVFDAEVDVGFVLIGAGCAVIITFVNVLGIKPAARFQTAATGLILLAAVLLMTGAITFGNLEHARPWIASPATGMLSVLIMVPALLVGFDVIPQSAEEINLTPARIGTLLMVSVFLAVAFYGMVTFSVAMSMPQAQLVQSSIATGDAATVLWGAPEAGALLVLGGVAGILTSWNAFVIGGSRVFFALAESGLVPSVFARLHPTYRTPYVGVIAIGFLCCLSPLFGRTVLVWLINAASFATIVAYVFVPLAFLALRRKEPELPRPFRVLYPRLVGFGAFGLSVVLIGFYLPGSPSALIWPYEWLTITIWFTIGVFLFLRYRLTTSG